MAVRVGGGRGIRHGVRRGGGGRQCLADAGAARGHSRSAARCRDLVGSDRPRTDRCAQRDGADRTRVRPAADHRVAPRRWRHRRYGRMTAPRLADIAERIPFRIRMTVRFRRVTAREGVLLRGPAGWGEWSPFPQYPPQVTATWLEAALEAAVVGWPAPRRRWVPVNCTVPAVGPEQAHAIVSGSGCGTAKVKVAEPGQAEGEDLARVEAVRDALGPGGKVRVDANGAWDVQTADRMLGALDRFGLEYAEQPGRSE